MTAFETDDLVFEGEHWGLRSDPLGEWLTARGFRYVMRSTANWRGYVARWEIVDGQLRLIAVDGQVEADGASSAYDGLVGLPLDPASGVGVHGLVWPANPGVDVRPRWCFDRADRAAVLVDGGPEPVEPSHPSVVGGVAVDPLGPRWRPACTPDQLWNVNISVPDGVAPADEGWYAVTTAASAGSAADEATVGTPFAPEPVAFVRRAVDPEDGRRWYRAGDLRFAARERRSLVIEDLFGSPAPIVADWFTGSLWAVGGELLDYVHAAFESKFEKTLFVDVEQGRVVGHRLRREEHVPVPPSPPPRRRWWRRN